MAYDALFSDDDTALRSYGQMFQNLPREAPPLSTPDQPLATTPQPATQTKGLADTALDVAKGTAARMAQGVNTSLGAINKGFGLDASIYDENAAYWQQKAEESGSDGLPAKIYQGIGAAPAGVAEFVAGVPYAAVKGAVSGYQTGGIAGAAEGAVLEGAKRFGVGKVFKGLEALPISPVQRAAAMGSTMAAQTAAEGGNPEDIAAAAVTGTILSVPTEGGHQAAVRSNLVRAGVAPETAADLASRSQPGTLAKAISKAMPDVQEQPAVTERGFTLGASSPLEARTDLPLYVGEVIPPERPAAAQPTTVDGRIVPGGYLPMPERGFVLGETRPLETRTDLQSMEGEIIPPAREAAAMPVVEAGRPIDGLLPDPTRPVITPVRSDTVLSFDDIHGGLKNFINLGEQRTAEKGQDAMTWDRPFQAAVTKAVTDYLEPAAERGLVSRDSNGTYALQTDRGNLRVIPPGESNKNWSVEFQRPLPKQETQPVAGSVEQIAARKRGNQDIFDLSMTPSQRRSLETIRLEVGNGEAGGRAAVEQDGQGGSMQWSGYGSTFPDYFRDKGYSKADTLNALDFALKDEGLTARQKIMVEDLLQAKRSQDTNEILKQRAAPSEIPAQALNVGDSLKRNGELFKVTDVTPDGVTLKDGVPLELNHAETISYDRGTLRNDNGRSKKPENAAFALIDAQAHQAASSPTNAIPEPSHAQIQAGNYKKGHVNLHGLDISIENPAGSVRKGVDETGRQWQTDLAHHYGYIKGTVGKDKDHIDVFIKPGIEQETAGNKVFVVDQKNTKTGQFDEHKVMLGFGSVEEARQAYLANYDKSGPQRIMNVAESTVPQFKQWLKDGNTRKSFADSNFGDFRNTEKYSTAETPIMPSLTRETVAGAFPGQEISQTADGFKVNLKNGATIKVNSADKITIDLDAFRESYGRNPQEGEKATASFTRMDREAVITLTEGAAGQIHHETFHAAMQMALNDKQRSSILKKYGTEEKAAIEYQRLRDNGTLQSKKPAPFYLQMIYTFFKKIASLFNPGRQVMKDVASGKVWNNSIREAATPMTGLQQVMLNKLLEKQQKGETLTGWQQQTMEKLQTKASQAVAPAKGKTLYSMESVRAAAGTVRDHLDRISSKSAFVQADIKPAMKSAGEGMATAWDGVKAAVAPMQRSQAAEEAGRILIEGMGRMERGKEKFITELNRAAAAASIQTSRTAKVLDLMQSSITLADKVFNRLQESERIAFMQAMDTGARQATPELQRIADTIQAMFEQKAAAIQGLGTGMLENAREAYFPHIWKQQGEDVSRQINAGLSKRPLEGSKAFSKARVFEDIMSGLDAGFELVSTNPVDLVMLKMAEMDKYLNSHIALQAMEASGLVQLIPATERPPQGYGDISGRYGLVTKRAMQDPASGLPAEPKGYRYIAREDVAQVFNNYLSHNLYNNKYVGKPFSAYMKAANALNQFQLGVFSAFHAGFTSLEAVISHGALGIKALTRGDYQEAAKYLKQAPAAWYLNPKLGDQVLKAWMNDGAAARQMPEVIRWLEMAGARRTMDSRFQTNATQKMLQAWSDGNKTGAALRLVPAIVEQSARPIMEWLVPRQKLGVFTEMAHDWSRLHPNASYAETRKAMQQIWNRVDSRLGQVVYDRLFVHNVAKNLTQALVRAPGWTGGTILEVGGGLKDLATFVKDAATGRKPELSDRAAYTLSLLVTTAVANALLTAAFTGEPPQDWKDLLAFRTGRNDEKGNPERYMLPTYAKDLFAYAQKPGTTLLHKTHPMLSLIGDLARNRDYYGTEIRHEGDNPIMQLMQAGQFTAKAFVPFWMKGAGKALERGGDAMAVAAPLIGIMPAPASMSMSKAEQLARELVQARMPQGTKTAEQFERGQLIQHLTGLARRDIRQASLEISQARQERKINHIQASNIIKNARLAPIQIAFKRLSYEEALRVYEVATDEEKHLLRPLMYRKQQRRQQG